MIAERLVTVLVLFGLLFASQPVQAMPLATTPASPQVITFYVDAVNGSNTTGNGSAASRWKTITYALSQSSANDTVMVAPGTYNSSLGEVFPITLKPGVRIIGAGPNVTIISGLSDRAVIYADGGAHGL